MTTTISEVHAPKCLASFYGAREATRETKRKNTAKSLISPGERPQEIYTPDSILQCVRKVWPEIALDPCSGPDSRVGATANYYVAPCVVQTKTGKRKIEFIPGADDMDGLVLPWRDYTYCNPPFALLKQWMLKARAEGQDDEKEVMLLAPARTNRRWFRDVAATATRICELDPVKFAGFDQAFPAPLWLFYWGANTHLFRLAFHETVGDVR